MKINLTNKIKSSGITFYYFRKYDMYTIKYKDIEIYKDGDWQLGTLDKEFYDFNVYENISDNVLPSQFILNYVEVSILTNPKYLEMAKELISKLKKYHNIDINTEYYESFSPYDAQNIT